MSRFARAYGLATAATSLVLLAIAIPCSSAQPAASSVEPLGKLLPAAEGSKVCYARSYGASHLRRHPRQTVTAITLLLFYGEHPSSGRKGEGPRGYYFNLSARLKGQSRIQRTSGECTVRGTRVWCGVECDGGGLFVDGSSNGITLGFDPSDARIRMAQPCETADAVEMKPSVRGEVMKLFKTETARCVGAPR
ncbi:MAG: hypothetical protein M5U07_09265 [Xanthobacteraceae bacterium]|nr:hypothetical protein [Xanthobacteraceae bacterium]PWB57939.1 MAG: hypothetical protein C3F17_19645 [Bradyrhizobiaceae bacterium]